MSGVSSYIVFKIHGNARARGICTAVLLLILHFQLSSQISPGDLSSVHSSYEGLSNCTQCHVLGNKVSADKCLACHTEIKDRINNQKGYHASAEVKGKLCFSCHSEHNGKNFQLVRLDIAKFDHNLTGYTLSAPHAKQDCNECHLSKNIPDQKIRAKKFTYLGVSSECLTCHEDYHRQTLSSSCLNCHTPETFKPASNFNHDNARFRLTGKHKNVECSACHKTEIVNNSKFQEFRGLQFGNCSDCHKDPHQNKFGLNCRQCHTEVSFQVKKNTSAFDHSRTGFPLEEKHLIVDCRACHKGKFTDPLSHGKCIDCHEDYHKGQFLTSGGVTDCSGCHSVKGFTDFSFTIKQHNEARFPLKGAHSAVPCNECHKKEPQWNFRNIGSDCRDCHDDIHLRIIEPRYYPGENCKVCHNESKWSDVTFDHSATKFDLTGAHMNLNCRECHFRADAKGIIQQKFYELSSECSVCHNDNHFRQFERNGKTDCSGCHITASWKESKFNHDNSSFKLDGEHAKVHCADCHKAQQEGGITFVNYKIKDYRCESCHY